MKRHLIGVALGLMLETAKENTMRKFMFAFVAGIALSGPAMAQDAYHIRIGDRIYINRDGTPVHRPAGDNNGRPRGDTALCHDGTYSFSQPTSGTCSGHGGVQR
jgi:hypothetical protein